MLTAAEHYEKYKEALDKGLELSKEKLGKYRQQNSGVGIRCCYSTINKDGQLIFVKSPSICYRGLYEDFIYLGQSAVVVGIVSRMLLPNTTGEDPYMGRGDYFQVQQAFYHWLANSSPWHECFITKQIENQSDFYVMNTSTPSNVLLGAIICSRQMWEHTWAVFSWYDLVSQGVNPHLAYVVAVTTKHNIEDNTMQVKNSGLVSKWHMQINDNFSRISSVKNFMKNCWGEKINEDYITRQNMRNPHSENHVFYVDDSGTDINKLLAKHLGLQKEKVSQGPFRNALDGVYQAIEFDEFASRSVSIQDVLIKELS
jgi:hypothetical protein